MKKLLCFILCLLSVISTQAETLVSGGRNRNIVVYAPKDLPKNRPLLISMHGANQDANYQFNQARYDQVADTAKFVVVYPDGENKGWDLGGMKDINFILDIITEMSKRYGIDQNRVYLSGFSMGGMMTYYAMTKIADRIAAFAPCSGYNMGGPNAVSSRPVPILHVHGTGDDVCTYGPVQSHLNAWVSRNGCNTTPKVEKPKTGPANTTAELIRYMNGQDGVEVAHLKLPGKGHWHSNDPAMAMTNIEIWNFCQRWSLTPGPVIVGVSPEENSFDLSATDDRTFTFRFDKPINCGKVKCSMSEGTSAINLTLAETGYSDVLTFTIPSNATPKDLEYRLQVRDITAQDGSTSPTLYYHYTYGVQQVGEVLHIDTLLTQDWFSQQAAIGEGIPAGWHRVNSNSDGGRDEKWGGDANTGGCRMKYFVPGGDFDAGFYFSAREYSQATFTYGETSPYTLSLPRGHYHLTMRSVYWNDGARNNAQTFGLNVISAKSGNTIYASGSLKPSGSMSEASDRPVVGSAQHEMSFEVTASGNYLLQYVVSCGWDGIILGPPTLTREPSAAERYKGEFLRALHQAQQMLQKLTAESHPTYAGQIAALTQTVQAYQDLVSTAPSVYEAARLALAQAMQPLLPLAIVTPVADVQPKLMFDLYGRKVRQAKSGIIVRPGHVSLIY